MGPPPIRTLRYFRDQYGRIARLGFLSVVSAQFQAVALVLVVPLARAIANGEDEFHGKLGPLDVTASTTQMALIAAGALVAAAIVDIGVSWARSRMMTRWEFERREAVVAEYLNADYKTQAQERVGTLGLLTSYIVRGTSALGSIVSAVGAALTIAMFLALAVLLDYRAALFLIGAFVLLSVLLGPVMSRTKRYSRALAKMLVDFGQDLGEATRMARDIRVFDAAGPVQKHLSSLSLQVSRLRQRAAFTSSVTSPLYQYTGVLLVILGLMAAQGLGPQDVAKLGAIALLLLRSMTFGQQIQSSYQSILDSIPYVEKLEEARAIYNQNRTQEGHLILETVHGIALENLRFSYDGEVEALKGISASFTRGEIVGIVGPSGGGKSTLSQLMLRLREPTSGAILANGLSSADYTLSSWYRHVSLVPQDPRLVHASVADNISFLDESISRDRIVAAAKAAGLHDVIEALDAGYETMIGPAFRDLSGGQIQRIGIARALVRGSDVLVLDEPTSALDVHSEVVIQETLGGLRGKGIVFIIAHRLSTLSICDRIMVLRDGEIETIGSLSDVSTRSDFFKRALDAGTLEIGVEEQLPWTPG